MDIYQIVEISTLIANTIILILIFLYQRNKNQVLLDRINQQEANLSDTKDIVSHQYNMIDSQKKIVESALQYADSFDTKKLEEMLLRKFESKYSHMNQQPKSESDYTPTPTDKTTPKEINLTEKEFIEIMIDAVSNMFYPLLEITLPHFYFLPKKIRDIRLAQMEDGEAKKFLLRFIKDSDEFFEKTNNP